MPICLVTRRTQPLKIGIIDLPCGAMDNWLEVWVHNYLFSLIEPINKLNHGPNPTHLMPPYI